MDGWVLCQFLVQDRDAALELGVASCDYKVRAVVDLDVGIDAVVFDDPCRSSRGSAAPIWVQSGAQLAVQS